MAIIDVYTVRARLYPAVIAAASAIVGGTVLVPWDTFGLPHAIATASATVVLALAADIARRQGRAIEPGIFQRMGGMPSTTMMRHGDTTFDAATKCRIHKFCAGKISGKAPTAPSERNDPAAADDFYRRCGNWLRENTRDHRKFKILFDENITYGFRRNLLGLKWLALALDVAIVAAGAAWLAMSLPVDVTNPFSQKVLSVAVFAVLHALYLTLFVNESGVVEAAKQYARQLLLCAEVLAASPKKVTAEKAT